MSNHKPITGLELQQMKAFWQEEDERNGGMSETTRCIIEIERLRAGLEKIESRLSLDESTARLRDGGPILASLLIARATLNPPA